MAKYHNKLRIKLMLGDIEKLKEIQTNSKTTNLIKRDIIWKEGYRGALICDY